MKKICKRIVELAFLALMSGCASNPTDQSNAISADEISDQSFDVLFATEFPVSSEDDALERAADALQEDNVEKALFFYVRALQFRPDNAALLTHIGDIQMTRKNYAMAQRAFLQAKKQDQEFAPALEGLGLVYMLLGRDELAAKELQAAIDRNGELWRAHAALGIFADKSNKFSIALEHYDLALAINPDATYVLNNRGYSRFLAGDLAGAVEDLYEAASNRGFAPAWSNLGKVYAEQGRYEDAVTTYQNVMSDAHAYNNTGAIALRNGDVLIARKMIDEAIRLSPTYFPEAERNLKQLQVFD
jgi:tetratricopeptide (TPR) repeat protein